MLVPALSIDRSSARHLSLSACAMLLLAACHAQDTARPARQFGQVDERRLAQADREPQNWLTKGRDRNETFYSPLARISDRNATQLGLAWEYQTQTARGLEATPIVVDGVMYVSGNWGRVYALDARTGAELWTFNPDPDGMSGRWSCCDVVNRGVAVWQGRVFVGSLDGYLYALDAESGRVVWKADSLVDRSKPYVITGAPQVAGEVVVIGNGGADFGVRGYISAFDLESGKLRWRFFTVPGDPKRPIEHPELAAAARTWDPDSRWEMGGGGTAWDGMVYDPELRLLYVGTGNGSPYKASERSPRGGDNLYLASILAIDPATGRLAWHYQTVPGESWDYTATQKMILADLSIDGRQRQVLMQAPKNGFFYVLDRRTGELLSARPFSYVNWAREIDPKSGRPIFSQQSDYEQAPKLILPSMAGAHNWQPMAFNPGTGLVYIPVIELPMIFIDLPGNKGALSVIDGQFNVGTIVPVDYDPKAYERLYGRLPSAAQLAGMPTTPRGILRAYDPSRQRVVWEASAGSFWDGGVMTTAGNLVVQGKASGDLVVYAADSGRELARLETGTSIMAAPMTYEVGGEQYIAVLAGFGGGGGLGALSPDIAAYNYVNNGRIMAFKLGGGAVPKPAPRSDAALTEPPPRMGTPQQIARGELLFVSHCGRCHALARAVLPDLRQMAAGTHVEFRDIVLRGTRLPRGMGRFDDILSETDTDAIHAYVIDQAWAAYRATKEN
jgi:quinohemoprotein ethanol dehydrogenase